MNCSNCKAEIKKSLLKSNQLLNKDEIVFINSKLNLEAENYCEECGTKLLQKARYLDNEKKQNEAKKIEEEIDKIISLKKKLRERLEILNIQLNEKINYIPVITENRPYNWEYTSLSLVTGQIVTGTGLISEIFSDVTDFFGLKSNSYTDKLKKQEEFVLNQLRAKSIFLGGNAVIATNINYSEAGSLKGMLMVCAAGTAIRLHNISIIEEDQQNTIQNISNWQNEYKAINDILFIDNKVFMYQYNEYILKYPTQII